MAAITSADIIADIQRIHASTGSASRRKYLKTGAYSERQIRKLFGSFTKLQEAAGLPSNIISGSTLQQGQRIAEGTETSEFIGDKWNLTIPRSHVGTLEELLKERNVDPAEWIVERFKIKQWEMGSKDANDNPIVTPLWAVSATLIKHKEITSTKAELESLKTAAKQIASIPDPIIRGSRLSSGLMLELNIPDLHLGKLSWSKETGYGNYDTKIAIQTFREALDTLLQRVSHFTFDSILLVTGNDLLHSDDLQGRTTSGTYVDNDGRYHKTFISARNMLIDAVEKLRLLAPIKIISCPGNHDKLAAWHISDSLECYFHNYTDVEVDNSPLERKYHQFGQVMLMFTHGNTGKKKEYPQLMASEEKEMWGATKYREAHTGHIHQTKTEEQYGVRVRTLPALCEPDAWHSANAFVGNLRTAEAYVWSNSEGLVTQAFYNAD